MIVPEYRITVDRLDPGEGGTESISFFATTTKDLFSETNQLRHNLRCSACEAARLALGYGLIGESSAPTQTTENERHAALP